MNIFEISDSLYTEALLLKKYNYKNLLLKKNRKELYNRLSKMRAAARELQGLILSEHRYSEKYIELSAYMIMVLDDCMVSLFRKERNYRRTVSRYVWGFHNLTRAFLDADNSSRISAEDAYNYFNSYIECN